MKKLTIISFTFALSVLLSVLSFANSASVESDFDIGSLTPPVSFSISPTGETFTNEYITVPPLITHKDTVLVPLDSYIKGDSLGLFQTTGYCSCSYCTDDNTLTYSGTVPQVGHTVAANLSRFPIGTKLMINDVVYTVEDTGSKVTEQVIDIYYDDHEQAAAHGRQTEEIFSVLEWN